jgi:hypothetical protein
LDHGPFKYRVECFDPGCSIRKPRIETMFYITWVGFLADWKRGK